MSRWLVASCLLACRSGDPPARAEPTSSASPIHARVEAYRCDVEGAYVRDDVLAAFRGEAQAWQACADETVARTDATTTRITRGSFAIAWKLVDSVIGDEQITTAGDSQRCVTPIVERLRSTAAMSVGGNGLLACEVTFEAKHE